jgi:putative membrane protein
MRDRSRRAHARGAGAAAGLAAALVLTVACASDRAHDAAAGETASAAGTVVSELPASATPSPPARRAGTTDSGRIVAAGSGDAAGAPGPLDDANLFALLEQANRAEVENGHLAERLAPSADVKAYARDVAREHAALQERSDRLARQFAVIPQLPLDDAGGLEVAAARTALGSVTGADFDRAYVASEVHGHERTLQLLQRARAAASSPELRALVGSAIPQVRAHLDRAKRIQDRVGVPDS